MAVYEYAQTFQSQLVALYGQELTSHELFNSNLGINIVGAKTLRIPKITTSGYKDHNRQGTGFNAGTLTNGYETKELDHDRDVEFVIDPMDIDETNQALSIANIKSTFERTQAIPELDSYTYSKLYAEGQRVGATIDTDALTTENILGKLDNAMASFAEAGVDLSRCILYVTPQVNKLLKNAEGIQRYLEVNKANGIDRQVYSIDNIKHIQEVPSTRLKTAYNFTDGCVPAADAKQINFILVDPEAQVSRVKHAFVKVYTPGHDSRTADNYLYQERKYNGTFGIDVMLKYAFYASVQG